MIGEDFKTSKAIIYAPLAGISDSPARKIAVRHGADMTVSELISSEGVIRHSHRTLALAKFDNLERPIGLQLFGANPETMAEAAKIISSFDPDFIDLNFGCPVRKVVGKNGGSSILQNLNLFKEIIRKVVKATDLPVTVKMRSGWDSGSLVYIEAGKIAQDCGAAAITLHPRTKAQGFAGRAEWSQIAELKEAVDIPVIGNGDIRDVVDVKRMFDETGCDGVAVARGALGNPWIFSKTAEHLNNEAASCGPDVYEIARTMKEHLALIVEFRGEVIGVMQFRKFFSWYLRGMTVKELKFKAFHAATREEMMRLIDELETFKKNPPML